MNLIEHFNSNCTTFTLCSPETFTVASHLSQALVNTGILTDTLLIEVDVSSAVCVPDVVSRELFFECIDCAESLRF